MIPIKNDWMPKLEQEFSSEYYKKLRAFLKNEYTTNVIYPPKEEIFSAFILTSYSNTKVVILGQDPYHGDNQAHGLAFSVKKGNRIPPSLNNIYKEIANDCGIQPPKHGDLTSWAEQGVLLLNTCLTVRASLANSHKGKGWENFTDRVVSILNEREEPLVFILWGGNARSKKALITAPHHLVLESVHPSPLSANNGFFGNHHFTRTNEFLSSHNISPINWQIPE